MSALGPGPASASGTPMPQFLNLEEVEDLARGTLPQMVFGYYAGGSGDGHALRENRSCFSKVRLLPRMLVDVSKLDTSTSVLGIHMSMPLMVAPMAMHGMAHPDGEVGTARAAAACGVPFCFSTMATSSQEEITSLGQNPNNIFQLYVIRNRDIVKHWVTEAERLGYKAVMVTVDAPRLGRREADERNRFTLPEGLELKNLTILNASKADGGGSKQAGNDSTSSDSGLVKLFAAEVDDSLTWDFIPWLKSITSLPVLVKGLLSPDDCSLACEYGVNGIVVSNHGGRQLDCAPSALEMLPSIVAAVRGRCPVLMDGGIRRGSDVLKALALGADAVLLGRPVLYGLALGGQAGAERVIKLLKAEFELAMALTGCRCIRDIGVHLLLPRSLL